MIRFQFKFLLVFPLLIFAQLQSYEQYDRLDGLNDPSCYIEGCVNVITGAFVYSSPDLVVDCPEELSFIRNYNSYDCFNESFAPGFTHNHSRGLFSEEYDNKKRKKTIFIDDKYGNSLKYSKYGPFSKSGTDRYFLDDCHLGLGLTNTYTGRISGKYNLKNSYVLATDKPTNIREIRLGDGTIRKYGSNNLLSSEIRPSGNVIKYTVKDGDVEVRAYDRNLKVCIGWARMNYNKGMLSSIHGSDGTSAAYTYEMKRKRKQSNEKIPFLEKTKLYNQPSINYKYSQDIIKITPDVDGDSFRVYVRRLASAMEGSSIRFGCVYGKSGRVWGLFLPGEKKVFPAYKFDYGSFFSGTLVTTPLGALQKYDYSSGRITKIGSYYKYTRRSKELYRSQNFYWGKKNLKGESRGNLKIKALADSNDQLWCATSYNYDMKGNVLEETLHGNLTGSIDFSPLTVSKGKVSGLEQFQHKYTYTSDGRNLMLSHEDDNGIREDYQYVPESNRVSQVLTSVNGQVIKRQVYTYNFFMALTSVREDNGSSTDVNDVSDVTCSMICVHKLIEDPKLLGFGKPEETVEGYLDLSSGETVQLKRKVYTYGKYNLVTSETLYDADDNCCYTLAFEYDSRGRLIREIDCYGIATVYKYNDFNLCVFTEKEGTGQSTSFKYDYADRLIEKRELHESGEEFVYAFAYDAMGSLVEETDAYGNVKKMTYDIFGRHIKTEYPPVFMEDGTFSIPTEEMVYDIYDRVVEEQDPIGNITKKRYTARGQLAEIEYPDGTSERYVYHLNGSLQMKYEKNGTSNTMIYDELQQLVKEETYSSDGTFLRKKEYVYDRGQLVSEIDALGTVTDYQYDSAGRVITKRVHGDNTIAMETYEYDSLGRLWQTKKWLSLDVGEYLNHIQKFDYLNRVIEDRTEDQNGNAVSLTTYSYDISGNCIEECCWQSEERVSIAKGEYTSFNMPLLTIDPMGNATRYSYDFAYVNAHGQKVFQVKIIDSNGVRTITTKDILGRDVELKKENSQGVLLSHEQFYYDLKGNKVRSLTDAIVEGAVKRTYEVKWEYDALDRVVRVIEDPNHKSKETQFTYHPMGMLATKRKPDEVVISYFYDDLGREIEMYASDQSVHYTYQYNVRDQLIFSSDLVSGKNLEREYDAFGNLIEEVLPSGMRMRYQYDTFYRILNITLPDESRIGYSYDLSKMTAVSRYSADENLSYTHTYTSTDMQGRSLKSELISGDQVCFDWDLNGRLKKISSPYFSESVPGNGYDAVGNLLQADFINGRFQYSNAYSYDDLNQVVYESTIREHDYRYDSLHNRLCKDKDEYAVNSLNQVERCESDLYQFDLNGNLVLQELNKTSYNYDALNRLKAVEREGEWRIEYHYDSFGRRVDSSHYLWIGDWFLEEEREYLFQGIYEIGYRLPTTGFKELRIMGKREGPAFRTSVAFELQGEVFAPMYDHIFNVVALVELGSKDLKEAFRYSAFGEFEQLVSSETSCPWLFSNQRYDSKSDLYHFGKRNYRPVIGRWISPDPGDFIDGMNLYAYTHNCPTVHLDFYGFSTRQASKRPIAMPVYGGLGCGPATDCVLKGVGNCVEGLAHHALPESPQRFFLEGMGRVVQGESFVPEKGFVLPSLSGVVPGRTLDGIRVRYIPGIMTTELKAQADAEKISNYLGGAEVHWTCQQSRGLMQDLALCMVEMMHVQTPAIQHLSQQIMNDYQEMQAVWGDNFLLCYVDHSRGGLDFYESTRNMPQQIKDKMNILTLGSAKILNAKEYGSVQQFSNIYDLVNHVALLTCKNLEDANFQYSSYSSGNPFSFIMDHFIESDGYINILKEHCESLLRQ